MSRKIKRAIVIGLGVGTVGVILCVIPLVPTLEENAELAWYFHLRGEVAAPSDVIVIGIDEQTASELGTSRELTAWPRSIHAELVNRLHRAGASAIVFDINFSKPRSSADDRVFADAIKRAGNVLLLEFLESGEIYAGERTGDAPRVLLKRRQPPIPIFASGAIASAPFPLPAVPLRVNQVWSFGPTDEYSPTLPVAALQIYALPYYRDFLSLLFEVRPNATFSLIDGDGALREGVRLPDAMQEIRKAFKADSRLAADMREALNRRISSFPDLQAARLLRSLIAVYAGKDKTYVNFFGPPRTVKTVPYHQVLQSPLETLADSQFAGKALFVGYSGRTHIGQEDTHYSVFSLDSGLNLSGTEIAATAFANLLERNSIEKVSKATRIALVFVWGLLLTVALCFVSARSGIALALICVVAYLVIASHQFNTTFEWWPLIVPLLIQAPLALYSANGLQFIFERAEKNQILNDAIARLDHDVYDQLRKNVASLQANREYAGICLATDIQGFSRRIANMQQNGRLSEVGDLMHEYWLNVVRAAAEHDGFVRDFPGDSAVAVWININQRGNACRAALAIRDDIETFNRSPHITALPTRIGLDCGQFWIGSTGTVGLGAELYGEPAITASRIENANKILGTRVLVSAAVIEGLEDTFVTRELGRFILEGQDQPVLLHELIRDRSRHTDSVDNFPADRFAESLHAFQEQDWRGSADLFETLSRQFAGDGPTRFYLSLSRRYAQDGPDANWTGVALRLPKQAPA